MRRFAAFSDIVRHMSVAVPYVPLYLHDVSIALSGKFSDPGYNYWYFLDDNYAVPCSASPRRPGRA